MKGNSIIMNILEMNTKVIVKFPFSLYRGVVVGKASDSITESYIIKCIDKQLPNEVYKYNTFIAQFKFIEIVE